MVHNAGRFWPGGRFQIRPGIVISRIGRPITDHLDRTGSVRDLRESLRREIDILASDTTFHQEIL
jgi:hypothetical protein